MMSIGLHPRIIGRPGRIKGLEDFIKHINTFESVWIPKRMEVAKYCIKKDSFNIFD
jgi:peptidoglycan/xylan/chitin deacetylase (PgdA/CDA1 family)